MSKQPDLPENQIRALFEAQDPARGLTDLDFANALPSLEQILDADTGPTRQRARTRPTVRRRVVLVAIGILMLALLTAAAWIYIQTRPSATAVSTRCFQSLNADSPDFVVGIPVDSSAEEACARDWERHWGTAMPEDVVACIIQPGGVTGVLPNPDHLQPKEACLSIGGALPAEGLAYSGLTADQVRALDDHLFTWTGDEARQGCVGVGDLAQEIQRSLDAAGASEWSVEDGTKAEVPWTFPDGTHALVPAAKGEDGQICADFSIRERSASVLLINAWPKFPVQSPESSNS